MGRMSFEKFREQVRKRNLEILKRSQLGETHRSLADRFNLSRGRIDVIVDEFQETRELAARCDRLIKAIREANDLDRSWPVEDLIAAIGPLLVTQTWLKRHFIEQRTSQLSLRALLDLAIPVAVGRDDPDVFSSPLIRVYGVGKKGFWSVVNRLMELNFGTAFNEEWQRRLPIFRREWKITGKFPYS